MTSVDVEPSWSCLHSCVPTSGGVCQNTWMFLHFGGESRNAAVRFSIEKTRPCLQLRLRRSELLLRPHWREGCRSQQLARHIRILTSPPALYGIDYSTLFENVLRTSKALAQRTRASNDTSWTATEQSPRPAVGSALDFVQATNHLVNRNCRLLFGESCTAQSDAQRRGT